MTNQERFEREAKAIQDRNQATMDAKLYLSHWTGYKKVRDRHHQEIEAIANKYGVDFNIKRWRLEEHWM